MNLLKDFTKFEKIWVTLFTLIILGTTGWFSYLYTDYTSMQNVILNWVISPISAITGIICVVLAAKGKMATFYWGLVNCATYGYIAYTGGVYGDAIINLLYFLPLQFLGMFIWSKKMSGGTVKSELLKRPIVTAVLALLAWFGFTKLLTSVDSFLTSAFSQNSAFYDAVPKGVGPLLDASTEIGQIFGQILMTFAKAEQWLFWIAINVISVYMWAMIIISDPTTAAFAVPTLVMWLGYLGNSFYGWSQWKKRAI